MACLGERVLEKIWTWVSWVILEKVQSNGNLVWIEGFLTVRAILYLGISMNLTCKEGRLEKGMRQTGQEDAVTHVNSEREYLVWFSVAWKCSCFVLIPHGHRVTLS